MTQTTVRHTSANGGMTVITREPSDGEAPREGGVEARWVKLPTQRREPLAPAVQEEILEAIGRACELLAILNPSLATLVRSVPHLPGNAVEARAYADGKACYYNVGWLGMDIQQQAFVIVHEWSHVALAHAARMRRILSMSSEISSELHNIHADLMINSWLLDIAREHRGTIKEPDDIITRATITETIPNFMERLRNSPTAKRKKIQSIEDLAKLDTETGHGILIEMVDPQKGAGGFKGSNGMSNDIVAENVEDENEAGRDKTIEHMIGALAGSDPWGLLQKIESMLPRGQVDWRRQLRSAAVAMLSDQREDSWSRRSRRSESIGNDVTLPGARWLEVPKVVGIVDTSGSVPDEVIAAFMAELRSMAITLGVEVTTMEADVVVHRVDRMVPNAPLRMPLMNAGRGGTDFTEPLRDAAALKPSLIVYLTDLEANEPAFRPGIPVIWCAVGTHAAPRFGKVIRIHHVR